MRSLTQWKLFAGGSIFACIVAVAVQTHIEPATVVEVADEPEVQMATVISQSAPQEHAPTPATLPVQRSAPIYLDDKSFDQNYRHNVPQMHQATFLQQETPQRQAALPPVVVSPKASVTPAKETPKPKPVVAAVPKVRVSSDNWDHLTPKQKWSVADAYVNAHHWECDNEGLTPAQQIQKLADHPDVPWAVVQNLGFSKCWPKK